MVWSSCRCSQSHTKNRGMDSWRTSMLLPPLVVATVTIYVVSDWWMQRPWPRLCVQEEIERMQWGVGVHSVRERKGWMSRKELEEDMTVHINVCVRKRGRKGGNMQVLNMDERKQRKQTCDTETVCEIGWGCTHMWSSPPHTHPSLCEAPLQPPVLRQQGCHGNLIQAMTLGISLTIRGRLNTPSSAAPWEEQWEQKKEGGAAPTKCSREVEACRLSTGSQGGNVHGLHVRLLCRAFV